MGDHPRASLSAVIVLWNSEATIEECLTCLGAELDELRTAESEILVVDNASTDASVRLATQAHQGVQIVRNRRNLGFGAAANRGVAEARGELVLILNPDAFLQKQALARLVDALGADPRVGIVGPSIRDRAGAHRAHARKPVWWRELWRLFYLDRLFPLSISRTIVPRGRVQEVDVLEGACLVVRREAFLSLGGFDESFFMYSEEWDFCVRARQAGWQVACEPRAEVIHVGGASSSQQPRKMFQELYRSKVLFFRKHGGKWCGLAYKLGLYTVALSRLVLAPLGLVGRESRRLHYLELSERHFELLKRLHRY